MMKIMRILGAVVLAAALGGCTLTEKQFVEYRAAFKQHPELRAKYMAVCIKDFKKEPRADIELVSEVLNVKVAAFPQTFCKRMLNAYLSGRLTYADYRARKATPKLIRILRGK